MKSADKRLILACAVTYYTSHIISYLNILLFKMAQNLYVLPLSNATVRLLA